MNNVILLDNKSYIILLRYIDHLRKNSYFIQIAIDSKTVIDLLLRSIEDLLDFIHLAHRERRAKKIECSS